jgi:hypothetical protein
MRPRRYRCLPAGIRIAKSERRHARGIPVTVIKKPAEGSLRVGGIHLNCMARRGSHVMRWELMSHDMGLMYLIVR